MPRRSPGAKKNSGLGKTAKPAGLKDVAAAAGVSVTTASRAVSQPEKVSPETLGRVNAAITKLGYRLNGMARALRSRRTRLIGAVLPTLEYAIYIRQVQALQHVLGENGYSLLIASSGYSLVEELKQSLTLLERGAEGLVLIGSTHHPDLDALLNKQNVPSVDTYVYQASSPRSCIGFDNHSVVAKAIDHLTALGHRRVAMIAGVTLDNDRAKSRVEGVKASLRKRGLSLEPQYLVERPYTIDAGRDAMRILLSREPAPTATFCGSDVLAFGALAECQRQRIDVPGKMSLIGFDNLDFCAHLSPGLTTIDVPAVAMGEGAARHLLARLAGSRDREFVELEANLILRGTTGAPA
jgi:LacI family transcriptional regulator